MQPYKYTIAEPPKPTQWAIYARRSSDEGSGKQNKSVPDQLKFCGELAEKEGIIVKHDHIFTENASAKKAGNRPVFDKLISMVEEGTIDGIIAWHPDRLSRNMLEAGSIIDLLDEGKIKGLKFCTHFFENTASGKMMLGILFAISKEYSDSLSEKVSRGVGTNLEKGISSGTYKWGYERNEETKLYEPHPENFEYIHQAFRMRLKEKSYEEITLWLRNIGCHRVIRKDGRKVLVNKSHLTAIFKDSTYYGVLEQAGNLVDLRELYDFQPMISENEFQQVRALANKKNKRRNKLILPFRENQVTCICGSQCFPDVGTSRNSGKSYLYIACRKKTDCTSGQHRMRAKVLMNAITKFIEKNLQKPTKKNFDAFLKSINEAIEADLNDTRKAKRAFQNQLNKAEAKLNEIVMGKFKFQQTKEKLSEKEMEIYEKEKFKLEQDIRNIKVEMEEAGKHNLLQAFDYEEFSNFVSNASEYWKLADSEQKHALIKFFFSNLVVGDGKVHQIKVKPIIEMLFVRNGGHTRT